MSNTAQYTLQTAFNTLHTKHCTLHTAHCTLNRAIGQRTIAPEPAELCGLNKTRLGGLVRTDPPRCNFASWQNPPVQLLQYSIVFCSEIHSDTKHMFKIHLFDKHHFTSAYIFNQSGITIFFLNLGYTKKRVKLITYTVVCRTSLATPGLPIMIQL